MKYTIEGFSQEMMVGAGMDATDAVILRWIVDFCATGKLKTHVEGEQSFYWIQYENLIAELPLLRIQKAALARRLQKMVDAGMLTHRHVLKGGSYSYFGFGDLYESLLHTPSTPKVRGALHQKLEGSTPKVRPLLLESQSKDSSSNSSTKERAPSLLVTDHFWKRYAERCQGEKPIWKAQYAGVTKKIIATGAPVAVVVQCIDAYFDERWYFTKDNAFDYAQFGQHWNEIRSRLGAKWEKHIPAAPGPRTLMDMVNGRRGNDAGDRENASGDSKGEGLVADHTGAAR